MEKKPFLSSALWPGIILGLLSVIPIVNYGNIICCLWVLGGGALAAVVFNSETKRISTADGAKVGLLAGIIGAFVVAIGNGIMWFFFSENYLAGLNDVFKMGELDPAMIDMAADLINNPVLLITITLVSSLIMNSIFGALGGLIGATVLNRKARGVGPPAD